MDALCFTVEIDENCFPSIKYLFQKLEENDILYISNEYDCSYDNNECICYRFEFDDSSVSPVSALLAEIVKMDYLRIYANKIIDNNYFEISGVDKSQIVSELLKCVNTKTIASRIYKFILENMHIHLGGFVFFRMKDYLTDFEDEIDYAIDEHIRRKKYREFVEFLKFFVEIQDSEFDEINVVIDRYGDYTLKDGNGNKINKELLDSTHCEISIMEDDNYILLNDLVSLAPKHIVVHCSIESELSRKTQAIIEIFGSKVDICRECSICK